MKALLIVDLQKDFLEHGALEAKNSGQIVSIINGLMPRFPLIVASKDWHPIDHCSFKDQQGRWPKHCVMHTEGSEFPDNLNASLINKTFFKGSLSDEDSFSAFYNGEQNQSTGLKEFLNSRGIDELFIVGLVLEHCVKMTTFDALALGYKVFLIQEGIGLFDKKNHKKVYQELAKKGAEILNYKNFNNK